MRLKALVVNPWITDFKLYDEWMHPVGLYFLGSFLLHNGAEVYYYNCLARGADKKAKANGTGEYPSREYPKPALYKNIRRRYKIYGRTESEFEEYLLSIPCPDIICVGSSMTYCICGVKETLDVLTRVFPGVPCIVGGTAATLMPRVMSSLLGPASLFCGSVFDDTALTGSAFHFLSTMTALPKHASILPGLKLLDNAWHGPALTSVGCPLSCSYCASRTLSSDCWSRPPDVVADEIEYLVSRFAIRHVAFYDDALLYRPEEHLMPFLKIIKDRGISVQFHVPNGMHVRWITPDILDLMLKSGFSTLRFGFESGSPDNRRHTGGKATLDELAQKVSLMRRAGFCSSSIGVYVMAGLPGQIPMDVAAEIDSVASLQVKVKPVFLSPVPSTPLFGCYATLFPELLTDPLSHNDSYFITRLPGWDGGAMQEIIDRAKKHNAGIV
jgi:hypothetical protein